MNQVQKNSYLSQTRSWNLDKKWAIVEDQIENENKERSQEQKSLQQTLNEKIKNSEEFQKQKFHTSSDFLLHLQQNSLQCKQNINQDFGKEQFYQTSTQEKYNNFKLKYSQSCDRFNKDSIKFGTQKLKDISQKINSNDLENRKKTQMSLKNVRENHIGDLLCIMNQHKQKTISSINKLQSEISFEMDSMTSKAKDLKRKRMQTELKLNIMIENLSSQIGRQMNNEIKEGQITYDSLLKLIEDSCSKIQQAQYR